MRSTIADSGGVVERVFFSPPEVAREYRTPATRRLYIRFANTKTKHISVDLIKRIV